LSVLPLVAGVKRSSADTLHAALRAASSSAAASACSTLVRDIPAADRSLAETPGISAVADRLARSAPVAIRRRAHSEPSHHLGAVADNPSHAYYSRRKAKTAPAPEVQRKPARVACQMAPSHSWPEPFETLCQAGWRPRHSAIACRRDPFG
jgi:hypothetical protein